jgi:signal transduction histidine kinase
LRNPLAPIANAVALAEQTEDRSVVDQALAIMRRQVQQLSRLVDDLLNIGRINTGRMELRLEVIEVATIVDHAIEIVQPVIDRRGQRLVVADMEPGLTLYGDSARLRQIIGNLLDNASKYSANDTSIWLDVIQQDGEMILSVRVQGIGIKENELPRVFYMFSQFYSGGMN